MIYFSLMQSLLIKAHQHSPKLIKCSIYDHFAARVPVSVAFFYPKHISQELIINTLKHVLNDFPIFAGILIEKEGQLYIDCNNQGVAFQTVHSEGSLFDELSRFQKLKSSKFVDIINPKVVLKKKKPLFTIKLNYYKDGIVIGYCWHHSLGDMSTFMEFLKALSNSAKGTNYPSPLIVDDRESYLEDSINTPHRNDKSASGISLKLLSVLDILSFIKHLYAFKKNIYLYFTESEIENLKSTLSILSEKKLSRNDVLCAHLLNIIAQCRKDNAPIHQTSLIFNLRSRLGMPLNALGNLLNSVSIKYCKTLSIDALASTIHLAVKNFMPENPKAVLDFISKNGGIENVSRIIPQEFLPKNKNLVISNWSNFDVYSIDFGIAKPYLFLPVGEAPCPWVSCIVEGFENKGLLVALALPYGIAKRFTASTMLEKLHAYRASAISTEELSIIKQNSWCL
jgi:hypothetical protein